MLTRGIGAAFQDVKGKLYPSVGLKKYGEHVRVNFGQIPFVFDIDGMMAVSSFSFILLSSNRDTSLAMW